MGASNRTTNLSLPMFEETDKPTWLGDFNDAMERLDAANGTLTGLINGLQTQINTLSSRITALATATGHPGI